MLVSLVNASQAMSVPHTQFGAITLGQSYKMLQLAAVQLSFVETTQELGGLHERIETYHQNTGGTYTKNLAICTEIGESGAKRPTVWCKAI